MQQINSQMGFQQFILMNRHSPVPKDRSPQPVRQPSPDFVTANVIASTRSPASHDLPTFHTPKRTTIPLIDELAELRRENSELRQQVRNGRTVSPSSDAEVLRLQAELRQKDQEIEYLRNQPQSKLTSSRKISLTMNESAQIRELGDKLRELKEENRRLREQQEYQSKGDDLRRATKRIKDLEIENQQLKKDIAGRRVQTMPDAYDDQRPRMRESTIRLEMERVRNEVNGSMDTWYRDLSQKVNGLEDKLVDITRAHAQILADRRKKAEGSTAAKQRDSGYKLNLSTPPRYPTSPKMATSQTFPASPSNGNQLKNLRDQLTRADITRIEYQNRIQRQQNQIKRLENNNRQLNSELADLRFDLEKANRQGSTVNVIELTNSIINLERENQMLRTKADDRKNGKDNKEIQQLRGQLGALSGALDIKNREISELRSELYKLDSKLDGKDRQISNLKSQITLKTLQKPDQNPEVVALNNLIRDLNKRIDSVQIQKNQQIIRLQSDNKKLIENLDQMQRSQSDLVRKLQGVKYGKDSQERELQGLRSDVARLNNQNKRVIGELQELPLLRSQVSRLRDENNRLLTDKSRMSGVSSSINNDLEKQIKDLKAIVNDQSAALMQANEDLRKQKERANSSHSDNDRLRASHTRLVNQLAHMNNLGPELEKARSECIRLQQILDENNRTVNQLRVQREQLIRNAGEEGRKVLELTSLLRSKEQDLIRLLQNKKSAAIESYLKDLTDLKLQLQSLNLQPIQNQIHDRNERLKSLLTEKISQIRVVNKYLQDIKALVRQNAQLRKDTLNAQSRYISLKEQNEKLRSWIESQHKEKQSLVREIADLKNIINEYINREVVYEEGAHSEEIQKEMKMIEEEIRITSNEQQRTVIDVSKIKANFQQAIIKLDSISNKIRQELAQGVPS